MGVKVSQEQRLMAAAARAEAAAARCEKLADLLELKVAETDGEGDALERLDAAICDLAEIIGGEE